MLVPPYEIELSAAEQQAWAALPRVGKPPHQRVRRATLLLVAQESLANQGIADRVGPSRNLGQQGRQRFALSEPSPPMAEDEGAPRARRAALQDWPRAGRPPACSPAGAAHGRRRRLPRG